MTDLENTPAEDTAQTSALTAPVETNQTSDELVVDTPPAATIPDSIDGYQVEVEGFNFDEFKDIEENKEFLEGARAAGLDNKALSFVLEKYNHLIPQLMEANAALDSEGCVQAMSEVWKGDTDKNFGFARAAAVNAIQSGILTEDEVNSPEFGNNPLVLKMAAYFGQQLNEDTPPSNTQQSGGVDVQSLMASEAYLNEKHADHKSVSAQVERYYNKTYK